MMMIDFRSARLGTHLHNLHHFKHPMKLILVRSALAAAALFPLVSCETDGTPQTVTVVTEEKETIYRRYPEGIVQTQTTTYRE